MRIALVTALLVACTGAPAPAPTPDAANTAKEAPASQPTADEAAAHGEHGAEGEAMAFQPLTGATISFIEPADGATVSSPITVKMGMEGAEVKPAGELVAGSGHHHIIVDGAGIDAGTVVPKDDTHIHFGDGSTETQLELEPGEHTLTLQFADGMHRSYGPEVSTTITVTVE